MVATAAVVVLKETKLVVIDFGGVVRYRQRIRAISEDGSGGSASRVLGWMTSSNND
jgi:hypothetical protein